MKIPFVPPKDRMISESEIKKMEKLGKCVVEEIKVPIVLKHCSKIKEFRREKRKVLKIHFGIKIFENLCLNSILRFL
jgi:glutamate formiminotransferase